MVAMHAEVKGMLLVRRTVKMFSAHAVATGWAGRENAEERALAFGSTRQNLKSMADTEHAQQWNIGYPHSTHDMPMHSGSRAGARTIVQELLG